MRITSKGEPLPRDVTLNNIETYVGMCSALCCGAPISEFCWASRLTQIDGEEELLKQVSATQEVVEVQKAFQYGTKHYLGQSSLASFIINHPDTPHLFHSIDPLLQ